MEGRKKNIKAFAGKYQTRWERTMCAGSGEKFTVVRWKKVDDVRKNIKSLAGKKYPTEKYRRRCRTISFRRNATKLYQLR